jgi:hypothetical protein
MARQPRARRSRAFLRHSHSRPLRARARSHPTAVRPTHQARTNATPFGVPRSEPSTSMTAMIGTGKEDRDRDGQRQYVSERLAHGLSTAPRIIARNLCARLGQSSGIPLEPRQVRVFAGRGERASSESCTGTTGLGTCRSGWAPRDSCPRTRRRCHACTRIPNRLCPRCSPLFDAFAVTSSRVHRGSPWMLVET